MNSKRTIAGEVRQSDDPDWTALERVIGTELMGHFMWLYEIELGDGTTVHAYKHCWTRRSLHLGDDGRAFYYTRHGTYREMDRRTALVRVFEDWDMLCSPIEAERAALAGAIRRATDTVG